MLDGVWRDEFGVFPTGSYIRNYIGSRHSPNIGPEGCTILVKLRQMCRDFPEPSHTCWDTSASNVAWKPHQTAQGVRVLDLFASPFERVRMEELQPGAELRKEITKDGEELFVVKGDVSDDQGEYGEMTWVRNPTEGEVVRRSRGGCVLWVKEGHFNAPEVGVGN